ncbi:ABC transporter ATP-binding protein [Paenibacillus sp. 1P07SE]|uniref:ABC transporter ATP-binding protein n=1 Tax=Paenibacillus sp. 1P07SE TaxID=3132209 RepID=UPI0039A5DF11
MKLEVRDVGKGFGERSILRDINLDVHEHEFICILGHSGCGKSTLLNMIAGYLHPDTGTISVDGDPVKGPSKSRGMVFQDHALFPWMTVLDNIAFGPEVQKAGKAQARQTATEFLSLVGLDAYADSYPSELSGGMKQRVGIARALAGRPEILLMDEPFGALDVLTRETMRMELQKICAKLKPTILFVTHSISEAVSLADRVVVMKHGEISDIFEIGLTHPRSFHSPASAR